MLCTPSRLARAANRGVQAPAARLPPGRRQYRGVRTRDGVSVQAQAHPQVRWLFRCVPPPIGSARPPYGACGGPPAALPRERDREAQPRQSSQSDDVSPAIRFVAPDWNATACPSTDITGGRYVLSLASAPAAETSSSDVVPVTRSRR